MDFRAESCKARIEKFFKKDCEFISAKYESPDRPENFLDYIFNINNAQYKLHANFIFCDEWVDMLCFMTPTSLSVNPEEILKSINYMNWNVKNTWGRFYIDDFNDIAYSQRVGYGLFNKMPEICLEEIDAGIRFYLDMCHPILDVCIGKNNFYKFKEEIQDMYVFL